MDKIARIRAEIERLKEDLPREVGRSAGTITATGYGMLKAYNNLLSFLDTLQEPEVDLEKEIDKTVYECTDGYNFDWDKFALHFYELGKNAK